MLIMGNDTQSYTENADQSHHETFQLRVVEMRAFEMLALGMLGVDGLQQDQRTREIRNPAITASVFIFVCSDSQVTLDCHSSQCGCDSKHLYICPLEADYGMLATWKKNDTTCLP